MILTVIKNVENKDLVVTFSFNIYEKMLRVYINFINFFTEIREFISMCHLLGKDLHKHESSYHILHLSKSQQMMCGILYLLNSEFCCSHN